MLMSEQKKVVSLEQEIIHKNTDLFIDITGRIGKLLKQGLATVSFDYREAAIVFDSTEEVKRTFSDFSPERVQSVTDELVLLTLQLLDEQEQVLLTESQNEGKTQQEILQKKINAVNQYIINPKLKNAYHFYRTCIGSVLEQIVVQHVIKPASKPYPSMETLILKLTAKDNMDSTNKSAISFEIFPEQLDDIIHTLTQAKKDFQTIQSS